MSFKSNIGKPTVEPTEEQCEMINVHHPDCNCASCKMMVDVQCLEPAVGVVPESGNTRVCGACAIQQEREDFTVAYHDRTRFVLVHPEMGIYLGSCMGMGFWSKLDPVGQPCAVTFENRVEADDVMQSWDNGRPDGVVIWPVVPDGHRPDGHVSRMPSEVCGYASVAACVAAGLDAWDPEAKPNS